MKKLNRKQQQEAGELVNQAQQNVEAPKDESDFLNWSMPQLNAYILTQTAGMKPHKKLKFAHELIKRFKKAKKLQKQ